MPLEHPYKLMELFRARDVAKGAFGEHGGGILLDCCMFRKVLLGVFAAELAKAGFGACIGFFPSNSKSNSKGARRVNPFNGFAGCFVH